MKKFFLIALVATATSLCHAQGLENRPLGYCVTYEKQHLFLQKDSDFNVVDYEIEWPEVVNYDKLGGLKRTIASNLAGVASASLDSTLASVNAVYGNAVTGQFKTIPDDRRFCYVTSKAQIVGYAKNHWIAYYLENKVEPQKLAKSPARNIARVVVFDTSRDRLFTAKDLVSTAVVMRNEPQDFYNLLFAPLPDDFFNNMTDCEISGVWTEGNLLCFLVNAIADTQSLKYTARMPLAEYSYVLSREGRRLFTKEAKANSMEMTTMPDTWRGDTIYNNVEKMPEFRGGQDGLAQYMGHVASPGVKLTKPARVYTSFIVDKEGSVRRVSVLTPVNPTIDRHAASVISGMPKFTPGEQGGKKVCVRMYLPISYK